MADLTAWRIAFARQAKSDLDAYMHLIFDARLPRCHHLHFLQMACEKTCKSYLCARRGDPARLRSSHAYVANVLPRIAKQYLTTLSRRPEGSRSWVVGAIRKLSRKIELLAPSVDAGGRHPANCEYPWENAQGEIVVPIDYNFGIDLAHEPGGKHLFKIMLLAIDDLVSSGGEWANGQSA
jgi:hypothetical protein